MKMQLTLCLLFLFGILSACTPKEPPAALTAIDQTVQTPVNVGVDITLGTANSSGKSLTYNVKSPKRGVLSGIPPNLNYQPGTDYVGNDSFTFTVTSGSVVSNTATVAIEVQPSIYPIILQGSVPEEVSVTININKPANASKGLLTLQAFDADQTNEGELIINGNPPIALFGFFANAANANTTVPIIMETLASYWVDGANTIVFRHTNTAGYVIDALSLSFQQ